VHGLALGTSAVDESLHRIVLDWLLLFVAELFKHSKAFHEDCSVSVSSCNCWIDVETCAIDGQDRRGRNTVAIEDVCLNSRRINSANIWRMLSIWNKPLMMRPYHFPAASVT